MIKENRISKYMLYAIGEIVLVIIGILIALWIAEWNTQRHRHMDEINKLGQIKQALQSDLQTIEKEINYLDFRIKNVNTLDSLLKNNSNSKIENLHSLFGSIYGMQLLELNTALFEDLQANGFNLIKNDSIRIQLINTFGTEYGKLKTSNNIEQDINEVIRPYYLSNFHSIQFRRNAIPNDLDKLWNDTYYHNVVNYRLITLRINQENQYEITKIEIEKLIKLITNYIQ